jgi:hypothetical protein
MTTTQHAGWIGVDLDGTLAVYDGWHGIEHIGEPIAPVVEYVKELLDAGIEVRIFTARMQEVGAVPWINAWCTEHLGQPLTVTDKKDFSMVGMIDDRATQVEPNTGRFLTEPPAVEDILGHWSSPLAPPPEEFKRD